MGASASASADEEEDEERATLLGGAKSAARAAAPAAAALKAKLGLAPKPPPPPATCLERWCPCSCCPELSYTTRLGGFLFCFMLGWFLSLTSLTSFGEVLLGNPMPFAFKYTVGNVLSLCSYTFLVGPARQCSGMCSAERRIGTIFYLGSFCATLVSVFYLRSRPLTVLALVVQFVAMAHSALSYLPSGLRWALTRRLFGKAC